MARTCEVENCINPVWGTDKITGIGYCASHQWKRTDLKRSASYKGSSARKQPERLKSHENTFGFETQFELFMHLWSEAKDVNANITCKYTGERLNRFNHTNLFFNCFAHVLPKKNWPYFRLNPANLRVVYPEFHRLTHEGTLKDRELHPEWKWDLWDSEVIQMKEEYAKYKKEHLLR